ncbi:unnamed protein product [Schistosoma curassoni]|uniref:Uncharacterized protein n=1 Tax=Schistosoma curassoni TaxID=6186 RepID=A0A183KFV2_9TREM|nr:unnamed protein product [Schistosoma curassoni]
MKQPSYTDWNNCSSRSYHVRKVSNAAFPQGGVGLEKVDPKNAHLSLSHGYPSPAVRSQQVRS